MTLREAVKKVIEENNSIGLHPIIFIFQVKNGEARDLENIVSNLIRNKDTEDEMVKAINRHGKRVLTIEDLVVEDKENFNLWIRIFRE